MYFRLLSVGRTWGPGEHSADCCHRIESGNATVGADVRLYESKNCIVHTSEEKRVVIQGLDGYIIAEKDNTLLICKLDEEQRIKEFSK